MYIYIYISYVYIYTYVQGERPHHISLMGQWSDKVTTITVYLLQYEQRNQCSEFPIEFNGEHGFSMGFWFSLPLLDVHPT